MTEWNGASALVTFDVTDSDVEFGVILREQAALNVPTRFPAMIACFMDDLEASLAQATEQKERAISRAQMTRSGHVYVVSNIGSFGEHVY